MLRPFDWDRLRNDRKTRRLPTISLSQPTQSTPDPQTAKRQRWIAVLLSLLVLLVYGPGLFGGFVYDDHQLIESNAYVRDSSLLGEALVSDFWHVPATDDFPEAMNRYYRPLVTLAYAGQFRLFGDDPVGYHVVSLVLHLGCVLLVFGWLQRRLGDAGQAGLVAAGLGAAMFALHPSRPESVSWISGSTDLWMAFLVLLGLWAWDRWSDRRGTVIASAAFGLALFAKEAAVPVPLLLLLDAWLLPRPPERPRSRLRQAALVCAAVGLVFVLRLFLAPLAIGSSVGEGWLSSILRVAASFGHYLRQLVWPWPPSLSPACQQFDAAGLPEYDVWAWALGLAAAAGIVAFAVAAWRRPRLRPWLADLAWFVVLLLPVLNLVAIRTSTLVAARFLYLPLLGAAALLARAGVVVARRGSSWRLGALPAGGLAVAAWGAVSLSHVPHLHSDDDLWTYEVQANPGNVCAIKTLTNLRLRQGRSAEAVALVRAAREATKDRPYFEQDLLVLAAQAALQSTPDADRDTLLRVRDFYDALDHGPEARLDAQGVTAGIQVTDFARARLQRDVPGFRVQRAVAYARTLELDEAERQLEVIVTDAPRSVAAWTELARVRAWNRDWTGALRALDDAGRQGLIGSSLDSLRSEVERARSKFAVAADADRKQQGLALADVYLSFGAAELARRALIPLLEAQPTDPELVLMRVVVESFDGCWKVARQVLEDARRLDPQHAPLWTSALADFAEAEQRFGERRRAEQAP